MRNDHFPRRLAGRPSTFVLRIRGRPDTPDLLGTLAVPMHRKPHRGKLIALMRAGGWKSINVLARYLERAEHNVWA